MRVDVITLFPGMFDALTRHGVSARAVDRRLLDLVCWNPREAAENHYGSVDDRPFGGGPGMVMMVQPLLTTVQRIKSLPNLPPGRVVYLSPQGALLSQTGLRRLVKEPRLILVAGRYEGIDERFVETCVDEELSIGDYVLSGGELPAMVLVDALTRLLPGALGDRQSAEQDSFVDGLLDCPHYTRPPVFAGKPVPDVLLSGDHRRIARWRLQCAPGRTWLRRPGLLARKELDEEQRRLLNEFIEAYRRGDVEAPELQVT